MSHGPEAKCLLGWHLLETLHSALTRRNYQAIWRKNELIGAQLLEPTFGSISKLLNILIAFAHNFLIA